MDSAIEHGYILTPQTGYIKSDVDIIDTEELVINGDSVVAVSYTHLDVYKRQLDYFM